MVTVKPGSASDESLRCQIPGHFAGLGQIRLRTFNSLATAVRVMHFSGHALGIVDTAAKIEIGLVDLFVQCMSTGQGALGTSHICQPCEDVPICFCRLDRICTKRFHGRFDYSHRASRSLVKPQDVVLPILLADRSKVPGNRETTTVQHTELDAVLLGNRFECEAWDSSEQLGLTAVASTQNHGTVPVALRP